MASKQGAEHQEVLVAATMKQTETAIMVRISTRQPMKVLEEELLPNIGIKTMHMDILKALGEELLQNIGSKTMHLDNDYTNLALTLLRMGAIRIAGMFSQTRRAHGYKLLQVVLHLSPLEGALMLMSSISELQEVRVTHGTSTAIMVAVRVPDFLDAQDQGRRRHRKRHQERLQEHLMLAIIVERTSRSLVRIAGMKCTYRLRPRGERAGTKEGMPVPVATVNTSPASTVQLHMLQASPHSTRARCVH